MKKIALRAFQLGSVCLFLCAALYFSQIKLHAQVNAPQAPQPSTPPPLKSIELQESESSEPSKEKLIYVIPIKGEIEESKVFLVRRGVKEALQKKADALLLLMDTHGGRVDSAEKIIEAIGKFEPQAETYTLVKPRAISAGALIASATRQIYMAPSSVIGALTPIMMSKEGGIAQLPESVEAKMTSAIKAMVRANAERHGHNPEVFDAMVDRTVGLRVNGEEVLPKGQILTLTTQEAAKTYGKEQKPLLSAGTVASVEEMASQIAKGAQVQVYELKPTGFEEIARWISLASPILLSLAFLCGYIEFKTPGWSIFGVLAVVFACLVFFGHYIAGLSGHENIIFFAIGLIFIAVEIFFFPGTVAFGAIGIILVLGSLLRAMTDIYPTDPILPTLPQLEVPLAKLSVAFVLSVIGALILARILPNTPIGRGLVLTHAFAGTGQSLARVNIGAIGTAQTYLRPSGTAQFGEELVDVVTQGEFIQAGSSVRVIEIEGVRVVVENAA